MLIYTLVAGSTGCATIFQCRQNLLAYLALCKPGESIADIEERLNQLKPDSAHFVSVRAEEGGCFYIQSHTLENMEAVENVLPASGTGGA